ncbi:MAG: hypothetical protein V1850_05925 [Candidatus Bathyarchaeota archaeon]
MADKIIIVVDLSPEEMATKILGKSATIVDISKRLTNDGKTVRGWRVEYVDK